MNSHKKQLEAESQRLSSHVFNDITKSINTDKNMPEFNIYDLKYYEDELDKFEKWFEG